MKNWPSLSCYKFSEDYIEHLFLQKNRFSPIYDVMKVWILLILPKNALFFALFDPFNPNIWNINPAYLVENFRKIILKKSVLLNNQFSPNYDVMKVWNLLIIPKNAFFALFDTFNLNIRKIYPAYFVGNVLKIILKKHVCYKIDFH